MGWQAAKSIIQYSANNGGGALKYWPVYDRKPQFNQCVEIPVLV